MKLRRRQARQQPPHDANSHPSFFRRAFSSPKADAHKRKGGRPDVVIAVMGVTGAGKSSFIATVTGRIDIHVGHDLNSETSEVKSYRFSHGTKNYVLVDTPGFDDSRMSNEMVTKKVVQWLESSYREGTRLSGIIYIHNISKLRMQGSAYQNMRMFRQLCENDAFQNVILATSFWDQVTPSVGARRECELIESNEFWAKMVAKGSEVVRLTPDKASCLKILEQIAAKNDIDLLVQKELVVQKKKFKDTAAGKISRADELGKFEKRLVKEKKTERRRVQINLKKRHKSHKKAMSKLRREQRQRRLQARWRQLRAETEHKCHLLYDRWRTKYDIWELKLPVRRMEAEQKVMEYRMQRLESEVRDWRNLAR